MLGIITFTEMETMHFKKAFLLSMRKSRLFWACFHRLGCLFVSRGLATLPVQFLWFSSCFSCFHCCLVRFLGNPGLLLWPHTCPSFCPLTSCVYKGLFTWYRFPFLCVFAIHLHGNSGFWWPETKSFSFWVSKCKFLKIILLSSM